MRKFIDTIKNIWSIPELRDRILIALALVMVYRLGAHVVLPGVDVDAISGALQKQSDDNGLLDLINMFSGGAFANASIFALGIMPYITASIVIQLMTIAVPYFQRLQKEGESGRRKITQITRYLTVLILLVQGSAYIYNINAQAPNAIAIDPTMFKILSAICLTAGSMFVMWLGEKITDRGIGNGISIIIMIGIIARLPQAIVQEISTKFAGGTGGPIVFILEMVVLFLIFIFSIMLIQAIRKVPLQYAKRLTGNAQFGGARQYIPLKLNAAGVMPIIFAQAIIMLPMYLLRFTQGTEMQESWLNSFLLSFTDIKGFTYNFVFFLLIVAFTYFYTAITVNPTQIAEDLKKNGGFVPGVKPGKNTANHLDMIMSKIILPGAIFLGIIAILPAFAMIAGVDQGFAMFFGGTSLLILVGVVLDTLQQIESYLLMRHYDGLLKSGKTR
ncbi:protein translocase subunit secY/sec61 alpha [Balneicella halophila]|uniref:Protein translocase subunit SecY n=1 Tax=Balneicella halophila TaxID=1537566 RepID=A0A7L4USJ4_BALHA|nr:preprotein translocase subunit SecY [Balneicella halophila]PVX52411.1 protein translocase subunit secY/sec61 alpha [Balneicella halophila]